MAALKIGILGAARITPKALIDPASVIPRVKLDAIAARDSDRARDFAARFGIARTLESYQALIDDPALDLIYNPLPINHHAAWTIAALKAGKHVLCEKPLAMNLGEAEAMLAAAAASGTRLVEAFHYRYHPAFATCLGWVNAGRIGEVVEIDAVFNVAIRDTGSEIRHQVETGGGAMMDLGCYPLHWALTVMGMAPDSISAEAELTPAGVDESLQATLTFPGGGVARLSTSMAAGTPFHAAMKITGSAGTIDFHNPLAPHQGAALTLTTGSRQTQAVIDPVSTYTWQLATLVQGLETGEAPLPTEGEMILRQQAALDAIYSAAGLSYLRGL